MSVAVTGSITDRLAAIVGAAQVITGDAMMARASDVYRPGERPVAVFEIPAG